MGKTYSSWNSVNEWNIFNNPKRGKQVFTSPSGQKQRMAYKIQDNSNFIIKLFRFSDIVGLDGNITSSGSDALISFFNSQSEMTDVFGTFDQSFFAKNFLLYTILEDTADKDKIQFTVTARSIYPTIGSKYTMVNSNALANILLSNEVKDVEIIKKVETNKEKVKDKDIDEPEKIEDKGTKDLASGTDETEEEIGNKFRYTMRTNGKLYLMEFAAGGAIDAQVVGEDHPNGAISWENSKVMWYTDSDSAENLTIYSKWIDDDIPLYTDGEITNPTDKEFLSKMFTDKEFRKKVITEYHKEYGESEIDSKSIKRMLFFKDGTPIFPEEIKPVEAPSSTNVETQEFEQEEGEEYVPKAQTKYF